MKIKMKMHSVLDCPLKPDIVLIKRVLEKIKEEGKASDEEVQRLERYVEKVDDYQAKIENLTKAIKTASPEVSEQLKETKRLVFDMYDDTLTDTLEYINRIGHGDKYHYNFDKHFNRVVAGLMGSTCYMSDTFEDLQNKRITNILSIANRVETNGHHSTFGHAHLTLEITGLSKAFAMVLNNEHEYCTSEKSARFTRLEDIDPTENALFDKWKDILEEKITEKYGKCPPFFDEKGKKAGKLAQENARYMISVYNPTNMVYTTSYRQLNYLAHWCEAVIADPSARPFYQHIKGDMAEFVQFVKDSELYSDTLEDHKGRKFSLFGEPLLEEHISSADYSIMYFCTPACLAQNQRHRTIDYHIAEYTLHNKFLCYVPAIIKSDKSLVKMWRNDMTSVKSCFPQGTLIQVIEIGSAENILLKADERECALAQKEIRDLTQGYSKKFATAVGNEIKKIDSLLAKHKLSEAQEYYGRMKQARVEMKQKFDTLSKSARCTAGYKCTDPCHFASGINLESDI